MWINRFLRLAMLITMACAAVGCGKKTAADDGEKILYAASSFAYPSLDAHKEYYGWYTSVYGVTETLFRLDSQARIQPWLAESGTLDGAVWTIVLKEHVSFSNGEPLTAEAAVRNIRRAAEENRRFAYLLDFAYAVVDGRTFTITGEQPYPTMLNSLSCPELAMLYLDGETDFDRNITGTGPFVIDSFEPEGTVTVRRNERYWDGEVLLDGAVFYYMPDDDSKLLAMQNGEIDCYNSVTAAAAEIYGADPQRYRLVSVPAARLQFYIYNQKTLSKAVREAIALTVDADEIAGYLAGTVTPTAGPFRSEAAYGRARKAAPDAEAAQRLLEAEGYVKNDDGYYAKDGRELTINIACYAARSLDTVAAVIQEQLRRLGIRAGLTVAEDPDATYIASGDFDLALYCMIADSSGDPEYFITSTLQNGSYFDVGGFDNEHCEALIARLRLTADPAKRADLANEIVRISIDEQALGYVALLNKITVLGEGVSGFAEDSPYDFYGINAGTDKQ